MNVELPYEIEWPLLHTMATRIVASNDAGRILGVSPPTAETLLQHLESIGLVWRLPANPRRGHTFETRDWEITPTGRTVVEAGSPDRVRAA